MKIQDLTDTSTNRVINTMPEKIEMAILKDSKIIGMEKAEKSDMVDSVNFFQTVPDSHFWTDINQMLEWLKYCPDDVFNKRKYLRIGLENTLKQGYNLKK